jgi:ABC-type antimicrobial peptide transport system permease subunit
VLSLAILAVAVADTALAVEPDQRVRRLVGARRLRLAGEEASRSGVVALMAGLIGLGLMALVDTVTGWHIISQVNWWVPIVAWVGPATVTVATAFLTCLTRQQPLGRQR